MVVVVSLLLGVSILCVYGMCQRLVYMIAYHEFALNKSRQLSIVWLVPEAFKTPMLVFQTGFVDGIM